MLRKKSLADIFVVFDIEKTCPTHKMPVTARPQICREFDLTIVRIRVNKCIAFTPMPKVSHNSACFWNARQLFDAATKYNVRKASTPRSAFCCRMLSAPTQI